MRKLILGIVIGIFIASGTIVTAKVMMVQVVTCTPNSPYACIGMPGTSSGLAIIRSKPVQGNPVLELPTESGTLATEEKVSQMIAAALGQPTPTPLPSATPTPTPTPGGFTPFDFGINFRGSAGFVGDGANETYCLADGYPTPRGGATFGWTSGAPSARNRSSSADRRLAGMNFVSGGQGTFRIDLPAPGTYDVRVALGETDNPQHAAIEVYDNTSLRFSIPDVGLSASHFIDAMGADRTTSNWPTNNAVRTSLVFNSSTMIIKVGVAGGGNNYVITHVFIHRTS